MAWRSENGHAEAAILNTLEDGGAERDDGSARSEDIVHQQDMFSAQAVGATNTEDMLHVIPTLVMRLRGLALVIAVTHNTLPIDLDAQLAGYAVGQILRLIVSAREPAPPMQWHGNNHIHIVIQTTLLQARAIPATQIIGRAPHIAILEAVDSRTPRATLNIPEKSRCFVRWHKVGETLAQGIIDTEPEVCQWCCGFAQ